MKRFTPQKFFSLPLEQRHKKCAEKLREAYEAYLELADWMGEPPLPEEINGVANRYHHHLAAAKQQLKEHNLLPRVRTGDRSAPATEVLPWAVYLDHLRSAHNIGSIIRTLEAFRLGPLLISPQTPDPEHKQVRDAAMGAAEWISWQRIDSLDQLPRPLVAVETVEGACPVGDFEWPAAGCVVIGNEETGISAEVLAICDYVVEIPLFGRKNSLNVANAFAIVAAAIRD